MRKASWIVVLFAGALLCAHRPAVAVSETLVSGAGAADVSVRDVTSHNGVVSGVVMNNSAHAVREIQLLIRYSFLWNDERHPGEDSPGRSDFFTVHEEIAPGKNVPFTHQPTPPLPQRTDGHFDTSVQVVGFSQVGE